MLISIEELINHIGHLDLTGVFHIGAHNCEEQTFYDTIGITSENVYWIDAIQSKVDEAKSKGVQHIYTACITDEDDKEVTFNITNNVQSSSVLEFGTHANHYKWCHVTKTMTMKTTRVDTFVKKHSIPIQKCNFWNLDIQGAELMALKSAGAILQNVDVIYTEVNYEQVYKGCPHIYEIDNYLAKFGFARCITSLTREGWGDAVYIRPPQKLSLCIATMDRWDFLKDTIHQYLINPYIDEIIISDENGNDCYQLFKAYGTNKKLRLYSNHTQLGAFLNKQKAVSYAKNTWVAIIDSDNYAPIRYFQAFIKNKKDANAVYIPSKLMAYKSTTSYDNTAFIGTDITLENVNKLSSNLEIVLQSGNFICTKEVFQNAQSIYGLENLCNGLDAMYTSFLFLTTGAVLRVIPGMEYYHCVHDGSITLQAMRSDFGLYKPIFENLLVGKNPFSMTLRKWNSITKPLSEILVNVSEFDRKIDGYVPFPIGMSWQFAKYTGNHSALIKNGAHSQTIVCAIYPTQDNMRRGNGPKNRHTILKTLESKGIINIFSTYEQYIHMLGDFKFVISPEGNGIDTHRTYEALMAGCIPIVESNSVMKSKYPNMPILYTEDYSELTPDLLLHTWDSMLDCEFDFSPLFLSYYNSEVQTQIIANSDYWCNETAHCTWPFYNRKN
jgi:FkbM family methyltransferase